MSKRSPMQNFKLALKVWFLLCVITFGGCSAGFYFDAAYTDKTSHNATLEVAYSYQGSCDKYHTCKEKWMGRFKAENGQRYDRDIDVFFYHRFVDAGRQPMPAYITLSKNDMGEKTPVWIQVLMFQGIPFVFLLFCGGLGFMFGEYDAAEAQRKWEQDQRRLR